MWIVATVVTKIYIFVALLFSLVWTGEKGLSNAFLQYKKVHDFYHSTSKMNALLFQPPSEEKYLTLKKLQYNRDIELIKNRSSLSLIGGARYYMRNLEFSSDEESNSKVRAGVQWQILKGGSFGKSFEKKKRVESLRVDSLLWLQKSRNTLYQLQQHYVHQVATTRIGHLLEMQDRFLDEYILMARRRYFSNQFDRETLLRVLSYKKQNEALLQSYRDVSFRDDSLSLPFLAVNMKRLFGSLKTLSFSDTLGDRLAYKESFLNRVSLSASLVGEWYPDTPPQENVVGAVNFSIPLGKRADLSQYLENRTLVSKELAQRKSSSRKRSLLKLYYEYRERLLDVNRYKATLAKSEEDIKQLHEEVRFDDYSANIPLLYQKVTNYYQQLINFTALKELLLIAIIRLSAKAEITDLPSIVEEKSVVVDGLNLIRGGERALYIWYKTFRDFDHSYLLSFLRSKSIKRVYLSHSRKMDRERLLSFRKSLDSVGITLEMMLSENSWIYQKRHNKALERIKQLDSMGIEKIHLDIEPQGVEGWRNNNFALLDDYLSLLKKIDSLYSGEISVALPPFYPSRYYPQIYQYVDNVTFMIYNKKKSESIIRKLEAVKVDSFMGLYTIALRCTDFHNELEFETMIDELLEKGYSSFAIFDLASYRELVIQ